MNITYLLGNGFDLNLGLHTKYEDFYDYYLKQDTKNADIDRLKKSINESVNTNNKSISVINWGDAELGFGSYTRRLSVSDNRDEIMAVCHTDICRELADYLLLEEERFNNVDLQAKVKSQDIIGSFFNNYNLGLQPDDRELIENQIKAIGGAKVVNIISFNYTRTIDAINNSVLSVEDLGKRLYNNTNYVNRMGDIIHIHGTVEHGMVFGLNDESQLDSSIFHENEPEWRNQLIKPFFLKDMGEGVENKVDKVLANSHIIYIYGMSLGETDKRIWQSIITKMRQYSYMILIINDYNAPKVGLNATEYRRYSRKRTEEFLQNMEDLDETFQNTIRNRIFISNENIFACLKDVIKD